MPYKNDNFSQVVIGRSCMVAGKCIRVDVSTTRGSTYQIFGIISLKNMLQRLNYLRFKTSAQSVLKYGKLVVLESGIKPVTLQKRDMLNFTVKFTIQVVKSHTHI